MRMRREEEKEFGGWCSGIFIFFSLFDLSFFYMPEYQHDMSDVRKTECRYPINKHGKI